MPLTTSAGMVRRNVPSVAYCDSWSLNRLLYLFSRVWLLGTNDHAYPNGAALDEVDDVSLGPIEVGVEIAEPDIGKARILHRLHAF